MAKHNIDAASLTQALERRFGTPLLGYDALARLLGRSRQSMRKACSDQPWGRKLLGASIRVGRRRYFSAAAVAEMISAGELAESAAAPRAGTNAP